MDVVCKKNEAVFNYRVAGIWIENGHVLLHRSANDKKWSLPGGRVALTEDSPTSLKREFLEELDIDVQIGRLIWVVENFFTYEENLFHEIGFYYTVTSDNHAMVIDQTPFYGAEGDRLVFQWIPISQLKEVELYPAFLRTALTELPSHPEHIIVKQEDEVNKG
ncbi:NUDIX hydrolase [Gracilibacillus sp. S3-1-1]|uniref:NUDIX hydrolase n=1 Tax=Gracilibacillus pellucidus TaxID=3095368 RepID=A0ACC6M874_9BACI|nr:NUDIX hydrolase [Gracilibacillus sp. S3-1-1]MDX8047181.1 NUDIX hydrolase [Gracilibacillus sp. S3-1-1]